MTIEDAQAKIEQLEATNSNLVNRVNTLEVANTDLITERKELKTKLKEGSNDEQLKAELENYKTQLETVTEERDNQSSNYEKDLNSLRMMAQLKEMGVETHNADALTSVAELVLSDATYNDGAFNYLNEDGTTRFNDANNAYSVQDKVNDLREGEKSYLFKQPTGGGATGKAGEPSKQNMTDNERALDMKRRLGQTA